MCNAAKDTRPDMNYVSVSGCVEYGPSFFVDPKMGPKCEVIIRSRTTWGTSHRIRIQFRGSDAYDALLLTQPNRELSVAGRLRQSRSRNGALMVIPREYHFGEWKGSLVDLVDSMERAARIIQQIIHPPMKANHPTDEHLDGGVVLTEEEEKERRAAEDQADREAADEVVNALEGEEGPFPVD